MLLNCVNFDVFFLSLDFKKIYSEKKKPLEIVWFFLEFCVIQTFLDSYGILLPS